MNDRQLRQTLDLAFKDRAPKTYRQMKNRRELATYLDSLTGMAMQSIGTAMSEVTMRAAARRPPFDDERTVVQQVNMARKTAEEVALSQAIEELPLEVSEDEAEQNEPMSLYDLTGDYWREKMQNETVGPSTRRATTGSSREN